MSAQTVSTCVVCGAESETFLCGSERTLSGCLGKLMRRLGDCAALADELDTTLSRQDKCRGAAVGYVSSGGDENPIPVNIGAMDAGAMLRDRLGLWARDLWETYGIPDEDGSLPPISVDNNIVSLSRWLMRHPLWMALHPAADDLFDELGETIRLAWVSVDAASGKVYIGQCSTVMEQWWGDEDPRPEGPAPVCFEELYAREGDWEKRCQVCLTIHNVGQRRDVMNEARDEQYVPEDMLLSVVNGNGESLTRPMLRSLRRRKRVGCFVKLHEGMEGAGVTDRYGTLTRVWTKDDPVSARLYRVGDVLDAVTNKWARQPAC